MTLTCSHASALLAKLDKLPDKDKNFAESLCLQLRNKGRLSEKQTFWFKWFYAQAVEGAAPKSQEKVALDSGFKAVFDIFAVAKTKLKFPKIWLTVAPTLEIVLSVAGPKSRYEGAIQVTGAGVYSDRIWYGRIDKDGVFTSSATADCTKVLPFLQKFAADPIGVAKAEGHLSGRCCFCNSPLTDSKSTAAGFGPVCAKNFGLAAQYKAGKSLLEAVGGAPAPVAQAAAPAVSVAPADDSMQVALLRAPEGEQPLF